MLNNKKVNCRSCKTDIFYQDCEAPSSPFISWFTLEVDRVDAPPSPPQNHLLPQEALSRLIVILQRLGFGESVPLPLLEAVDPHAQPEGEPEGGYYN